MKNVAFCSMKPKKLRAIKLLAKEMEEGRLTDLGIRSSMDWCNIMELIVNEQKTDLLLDILKSLHKDSGHIPRKVASSKKEPPKLRRLRVMQTNVSNLSSSSIKVPEKMRLNQSAMIPSN